MPSFTICRGKNPDLLYFQIFVQSKGSKLKNLVLSEKSAGQCLPVKPFKTMRKFANPKKTEGLCFA